MRDYVANWLRQPEVLRLFAVHGFSPGDAQAWLTRAIQDRGIVSDRQADPQSDLFRLDRTLPAFHARRWRPSVDSIDWDWLTIYAPPSWGAWRPYGGPSATIEVSAIILRQELAAIVTPAPTRRRGRAPRKRQEIAAQMRRDLAEGTRTPTELRDMLGKQLAEAYGASRSTVGGARDEVLQEAIPDK